MQLNSNKLEKNHKIGKKQIGKIEYFHDFFFFCSDKYYHYENILSIKKTWATGLTTWICKGLMESQNLDMFHGYLDIHYDNPEIFEKWKHLKSNLPVCILAVKFD